MNNNKKVINEMLDDYCFMDKLNNKECNEILMASLDENPKISLKIINKWEKHNGLVYDRSGKVDYVALSYGITKK